MGEAAFTALAAETLMAATLLASDPATIVEHGPPLRLGLSSPLRVVLRLPLGDVGPQPQPFAELQTLRRVIAFVRHDFCKVLFAASLFQLPAGFLVSCFLVFLVPKLCLGTHAREALPRGEPSRRRGASGRGVPRQSLGTREREKISLRSGNLEKSWKNLDFALDSHEYQSDPSG